MLTIPQRRFSFKYDGADAWQLPYTLSTAQYGGALTDTYDFPRGLRVTSTVRSYPEFGAVEWVNWLENTGDAPTGLISALWDCDAALPVGPDRKPTSEAWLPHAGEVAQIRAFNGSSWSARSDDFAPAPEQSGELDLFPAFFGRTGEVKRYAPHGGRSSDAQAPYFDICLGQRGYIAALGWSGQWHAEFERERECVRLRSGVADVCLRLLPGERIRTSSVLIMEYDQGRTAACNQWRRLMRAHVSPFAPDADAPLPLCAGIWGGMTTEEGIRRVRALDAAGLPVECVWMDAGWYGDSQPTPDEFEGDWFAYTGDWRVSASTHPDGLIDFSAAVHDSGRRFMLWFEPERIQRRAPVRAQHPEYMLELDASDPAYDGNALLNLGDERAWQYCFEQLAGHIEALRIDIYRQDFNTNPLPYWRAHDGEGRRGMTEIKHIMGLYRLWDALLERFPGLMIDNCASGGRRLDFEAMRRGTPMWRSDVQCPANHRPESAQNHMLAFSRLFPFTGTGSGRIWGDAYRFRSAYAAGLTTNYTFSQRDSFGDDPAQLEWLKRYMGEYLRVRPYLACDFYPLTDESASDDAWSVSCFDRPERGDGVLLAFRRARSPFAEGVFALDWLRPGRAYEFTDADTGVSEALSADALRADGYRLAIGARRASRVVFYRLLPQ